MRTSGSRLVCAGCGAEPPSSDPYGFRCPRAGRGDDVDHVLRRELDLGALRFPAEDDDPNPFVRYRTLTHAYHLAADHGLSDAQFVALVRRLDARVAASDGHGLHETPFARSAELSDALGLVDGGGVWIKDETGNVAGSHKARHLFGVLVYLEVAEAIGLLDARERAPLAIASCGNAALAAGVLAAAAERELHVLVPADADPIVLERLDGLGARLEVCPRDGRAGDPTYRRLLEVLADGAIPFTCQGNLNGLAIEGGETLGWELVASGASIDRVVVQVGGGALASACIQAFGESVELEALAAMPCIDTVQTSAAWPLKRAFDAVGTRGGAGDGLRFASHHRSSFMWPWEDEPHSVAHGILDDETYDWRAVVAGMLATGGRPLVVGEELLERANRLGRETTGIDVDHTGTSGLAGLLALREAGDVADDESVAVLFTGAARTAPAERRRTHEELPRTRHPVAQGLRAG